MYRDWKHRCRYPRHFLDDPAMTHVAARFDRITTPIVAANALDDLWAPPATRDAFMAGYRNTRWQAVDIDPAQCGRGPMGRMRYFRRKSEPLWREVLTWFGEHETSSAFRGAMS